MTLVRYQAYELVNIEDRSILRIPAPGAVVYAAADVERVLTELQYLVNRHEESKSRAVTIDWSRAQRLLKELAHD